MTTTNPVPHPAPGKVYLVGAGPGDPGLITLRGKYLLEHAQAVVYDYLANPKLLGYVPKTAERIYAGKKGGGLHAYTQENINKLLVRLAREGKMVVRLKGGDPFIFGRGGEEIEELVSAGIDFEVVPGVTSATAAATYAGIPITHREYTASVAFVTGHEDPAKKSSNICWEKLATAAGTIVVYMGIKTLPNITQKLMDFGRSPETPVAVVRWASTPQQRSVVGTLATICDIVHNADIRPPALVIVGEVVNLRNTIDWFEKRPLFGRRIVVTRTREQASELVAQLEEYGAECLEYSTIHIEPVDDFTLVDRAIGEMATYQWVLFTSLNTVSHFFQRLAALGYDSRLLAGTKVAAVGKATAEALHAHGITADLVPQKFTGQGLAEALLSVEVKGNRILLPRALHASDILPEMLTDAGAEVIIAPVYRNVPQEGVKDELRDQLLAGSIDMVTFTSSSTVTNFLAMIEGGGAGELHRLLDQVDIAAIGPVTGETVQKYGLAVTVQPQRYTISDMVQTIVAHYRNKSGHAA
ncbi:uroporphyrinogen-III C-methyltransferase [Desulfobulbus oligotrophicus]|uniref:uroporphyrinogen-III C-methyltransferase n=1 Tax=Desulfobulbus oligotrophicus TaxID=1909699 RepID=A0A7T6APK8_9BACT|nr:uroporphyrinogen-III C-methyltransferase [Desulfobulbus oligotrophicus]QQG64460.1 uroporphyrinogen-III C-methyltransferase [Desulfobulbus oligotrophicus]